MADLATAQKTFEALKKAYAAGDAAKTASLIGTLKVREGGLAMRLSRFAYFTAWPTLGPDQISCLLRDP